MDDRDKIEGQIVEGQALLDKMDEKIEIVKPDEPFPWAPTIAEKRRTFIIQHYLEANIDVYILIENMQKIDEWVVSGVVPKKPDDKKRHLKVAGD